MLGTSRARSTRKTHCVSVTTRKSGDGGSLSSQHISLIYRKWRLTQAPRKHHSTYYYCGSRLRHGHFSPTLFPHRVICDLKDVSSDTRCNISDLSLGLNHLCFHLEILSPWGPSRRFVLALPGDQSPTKLPFTVKRRCEARISWSLYISHWYSITPSYLTAFCQNMITVNIVYTSF
jgi:hypothetical protein